MCRPLILLMFTIAGVSCQLGMGMGGIYGNPYGMGFGYPGMGTGMGMGIGTGMGMGAGYGLDALSNPYGYGPYYNHRCRTLLGLSGMYNPMYGSFMGK